MFHFLKRSTFKAMRTFATCHWVYFLFTSLIKTKETKFHAILLSHPSPHGTVASVKIRRDIKEPWKEREDRCALLYLQERRIIMNTIYSFFSSLHSIRIQVMTNVYHACVCSYDFIVFRIKRKTFTIFFPCDSWINVINNNW